jgi:archaemetzincin
MIESHDRIPVMNMKRIAVVALGNVATIIPKVVAAHISGYLSLPAETLIPLKLPRQALDKGRRQYNAALLLQTLEKQVFEEWRKVVALLDVDLFIPIFTHVFGESRQGGRIALVSLYRLRCHPDGSQPNSALLYERAAKIALHELGHLFDLRHCEDPFCLMHFSGGLEDLDRTPIQHCRYCHTYMRDAIQS